MTYTPKYLLWATSYNQEVKELAYLIGGEPGDVELLKCEYEDLTGDEYKEKSE